MAEIRGVKTTYAVEIDVAQMVVDDAAEHGIGWSAGSLLALCGDLIESGRGDLVWRELMALRDVEPQRVRQALAHLGPSAALVRHGISAVENREASVAQMRRTEPEADGG